MAKKKTNPRRIPLAKKEINKDEILHEATQGKMNDAWILVENELYDQGYRNLSELNEAVGAYVDKSAGTAKMERAEAIMGIPTSTHLSIEQIKETLNKSPRTARIFRLSSSEKLEIYKVFLRKTAFIRTQIFSESALAE